MTLGRMTRQAWLGARSGIRIAASAMVLSTRLTDDDAIDRWIDLPGHDLPCMRDCETKLAQK